MPSLVAFYKGVRNESGELIDFRFVLDIEQLLKKQASHGKSYTELQHAIKEQGLFQRFKEVVESGKSHDFEVDQYLGRAGPYRVTLAKLGDGLLTVIEDSSATRRNENELRKHQTLLEQTEKLTQSGTWEYDVKTGKFLWSDGMYELFGISPGIKVKPSVYIDHVIDSDKPIAVKIARCIENTYEPFEEVFRLKRDGQVVTVKVKGDPLENGKGDIEKMLGVDWDITTLQQSAEKITNLNKQLIAVDTELKNFATIAANSFSETLRHLYIFLELIVTHDARTLSNSGRANLRRAQSAIQKMKLLTDDINRYLRLYDIGISKSSVDANKIIENVLSSMSKKVNESNATVELPDLPPVQADPLLFSILMTDLIDNCIKFRKTSWTVSTVIKINCSRADEMNSVPMAARDTPYLILSVSDNGIGFPDDQAEKIFELFFQLKEEEKPKGSGIGLAICKKIMEMHGGFITAEGVPAQGATFYCYFPTK